MSKRERSRAALSLAIKAIPGGMFAIAESCGVSYEAVRKWRKNGLPKSEWTGETQYSKSIATLQDAFSQNDLLCLPDPSGQTPAPTQPK